MPLAYTVYPLLRIVRIFVHDRPTIADWLETLSRVFVDPSYQRGFDFVVDRTQAVGLPASCDVRLWAHRHAEISKANGGGRLAFVANDPAIHEVMRAASTYAEAEGFKLDVFGTDADALRWLGHPVAGEGTFAVGRS